MPLRYRSLSSSGIFFITTSTHNRIVRFFTADDYQIAIKNIEYYRQRDCAEIFSYVIMPNHIHLLLYIPGEKSISAFMRDVKKRVAYEYFHLHRIPPEKFWQHRFDDVHIFTEEVFLIKLNYIHNNPVKAGLVSSSEEWPYSSVGYYQSELESPIKLTLLG